jgi:hypothetical protein
MVVRQTAFAKALLGYLQKRDPGRTFVLGERLSYVLLPGMRTQDDYELYWHNKLRRPLTEILTTCLSPTALQASFVKF